MRANSVADVLDAGLDTAGQRVCTLETNDLVQEVGEHVLPILGQIDFRMELNAEHLTILVVYS